MNLTIQDELKLDRILSDNISLYTTKTFRGITQSVLYDHSKKRVVDRSDGDLYYGEFKAMDGDESLIVMGTRTHSTVYQNGKEIHEFCKLTGECSKIKCKIRVLNSKYYANIKENKFDIYRNGEPIETINGEYKYTYGSFVEYETNNETKVYSLNLQKHFKHDVIRVTNKFIFTDKKIYDVDMNKITKHELDDFNVVDNYIITKDNYFYIGDNNLVKVKRISGQSTIVGVYLIITINDNKFAIYKKGESFGTTSLNPLSFYSNYVKFMGDGEYTYANKRGEKITTSDEDNLILLNTKENEFLKVFKSDKLYSVTLSNDEHHTNLTNIKYIGCNRLLLVNNENEKMVVST